MLDLRGYACADFANIHISPKPCNINPDNGAIVIAVSMASRRRQNDRRPLIPDVKLLLIVIVWIGSGV